MTASERPAVVSEWESAQKVQISVDLITAAKQELAFLAIVDGTPALKSLQVLNLSVIRYLSCWLPLPNKYTPSHLLQPPLDCAWVWHCHKLNPVQYAKDCHQLFGKLVDVGGTCPNTTDVELDINTWARAFPDVSYHFVRAGDIAP
ncbi:unnamed protein product [Calypogeia fissa]